MPFCLSVFARFRKNETVIGMIGHIQGIQTANNPPTNPINNRYSNERETKLSLPPLAFNSLTTGCQRSTLLVISDGMVTAVVSAAIVSAL